MSTRLRTVGALAAAVAIAGTGCGSTSTTALQPSPVKCAVQVSPVAASIGAAGGAGTVTVTAQPECGWSAIADAIWISKLTPASAQGSAQVQFQAAANSGPDRSGTFTVADQTVTVSQAAGCAFTVQPTTASIGAGGGPVGINVSTGSGCTWTAASQVTWITLTGGSARSGSGTASFSASSNTGVPRSGTLLVAGRIVTVAQASGCTFSIDPESQVFGSFGGNGTVGVTPSTSGCAWIATSSTPWITIRSGASGTGAGIVVYTVSPSIGGTRTGSIAVADRTFTVTQN